MEEGESTPTTSDQNEREKMTESKETINELKEKLEEKQKTLSCVKSLIGYYKGTLVNPF